MYFHVSLLMLSWYFNLLITLKRGISWLFLTNKWLDFFSVCFHFSSSHMPVICSLFLDVRHQTWNIHVPSPLQPFRYKLCFSPQLRVQEAGLSGSDDSKLSGVFVSPVLAGPVHSTKSRSLNSNNNKILECLPNPAHFWPSKCHLLFLVHCFLEIFSRIITTRVLAA